MAFPVKLDENLGARGQNLLKRAGFDVATVQEQNLAGAPDLHLIQVCQQEKRCLITLDLDFSNPIQFPPQDYAGVVVLRCTSQKVHQQILEALEVFSRAASIRNSLATKLWIVSPQQIREYAPGDHDP